jgi:O-antigen ligase
LLALASAAAWLAWRSLPTPPPPLIRSPAQAALGVNVALDQYDPTRLTATLDRLQAAGVLWTRQRFPWDRIEPEPGHFDWTAWDPIVAGAAAHNLHLIALLDGSPAWARRPGDGDNPLAPPQERADFGRFVAAFAQRYGDRIDVYQIWDEPNIAPHWGQRSVDPPDYLGLLREGFYQVRAADPSALILLAALAPNDEAGGANLSDVTFLDTLYALGGAAWFDGVAAEPYGFDSAPDGAPDEGDAHGWGRAAALRAVMEHYGDRATPVWATAFGWNALPSDWQGRPSLWGEVDAATQAAYLRAAVTRARQEWPWLGPALWATLQPSAPADDPRWGFALWGPDGTARPAWDALTALTTQPTVVGLGTHSPDHPALRYEGGWRVTPAAADIGATGNRLTIPFWGRGLALQLRRGPYWAYLTVTVDGQPSPLLPRDPDGRAYLVLYAHAPQSDVVDLAAGLAPGAHEVTIEATGGWGQWAIERVIVRGDAPPARPWLPSLLAVMALVPAGVLIRSLRRGEGPPALAALGALADLLDLWAERLFFKSGIPASAVARENGRALRLPASGFRLPTIPRADHEAASLIITWALALLVALAPIGGVRLAALLALAVVLWFRPDRLPPLIMLALPFYLRPLDLAGRAISAPELGIILGVAILAGRWFVGWAAGRTPWRSTASAFDWPVLAFVGAAILATLFATERDVALRELRVVIVEAGLFYFILTRSSAAIGRPFSPWPTVDAFVAGAALASLIGLNQFVTGAGLIEAEGVHRARALYGSPNNLALYLDRVLPVLLAIAIWGRGRRRWLYAAAAALVAVTCFLTFSKGAWFLAVPASVATLALVAAWRARSGAGAWRRPLWIALVVLIVMGAILLPFLGAARFSDLLGFAGGTGFFRLRLWQGAWQMALDHPWLGVGPDNFLYQYRSRYVLPDAWGELNLSHPHNIVLDLWTRLGVAGLAVGAWIFVRSITLAWRRAIDERGVEAALAAGLLASLVATVAHGLIDNSIFLVDLGFVWMMTLALLAELEWRQ